MRSDRRLRRVLPAALAGLALLACPEEPPGGGAAAPSETAASVPTTAPVGERPSGYAGTAACATCHPSETAAWRGSQHDLAMQEATAGTVLGDFSGATFTQDDVTTTFSHEGDHFRVRTDGRDGALADFDIAYTFGVDPLQQYLVRFSDGRVQALGVAWDTRPAEEGGQRWYSLYPGEHLRAGDPLHWTGIQQNWNHMCAECHSTGVRKGYDPDTDRFDTTWVEIDVACEACHGPGARHVEWARSRADAGGGAGDAADVGLPVHFGPARHWAFVEGQPIARPQGPTPAHDEIEVCGRCHSRRALLFEADASDRPLLDTHRVSLLEPDLYQVDGQIEGEVYVYGSFLQSRMYAAGVRCHDCHDPHSLRLVADGGPDAVCAGCHRPEVFARESHHHHPPGSAGASCVACHMPTRTYMGVDVRRDHGFRVPRPDLSARLATSDVCTGCHADRSLAWASEALRRFGASQREGQPQFGIALKAAREHRPGAREALIAVIGDEGVAGIARATALEALGALGAGDSEALVAGALADPDPLVRMGALEASASLEPRAFLRFATPLLRDPVLAVRLGAERVLRGVPPSLWSPADRSALASVQSETRAVQRLSADRPEAWIDLGNLDLAQGDLDRAASDYQRAITIEPDFVPALVNLADLERQRGRDDEGEKHLRRAALLAPDDANVQHALGLLLIRQGRRDEAVRVLGRAALLAPDEPRFALVHALAIESTGRTGEARVALESALERFPDDPEILFTLATWARDRADWKAATGYARRLVDVLHGDPGAQQLLDAIEASAAGQESPAASSRR